MSRSFGVQGGGQGNDPYGVRRAPKRDPRVATWVDDRFLIEERIATGGFGAVYRARTVRGTAVALKLLHPSMADDPAQVARFEREGAILTQLHDPHTVATVAVGTARDGTRYIAMELLTGESLEVRLARERALPWQLAAAIARAVCSSLAEAHALGIVHRDLKPANICIEPRGDAEIVKVIDFGVGKIAPGSAADDGRELTGAGYTLGTFDYMSPEQIVGEPCEAASDLYSLGVVLYELLAGQRPFSQAMTPAVLATALLTQAPQPPSIHAAIPPALDRIVLRCLERDPRQRFASADALAAALDRLLGAPPTTRDEITAQHAAWHGALGSDDVVTLDGHPLRRPPAEAVPEPCAGDNDATVPVPRITRPCRPRARSSETLIGVGVGTGTVAQHPDPSPVAAPPAWLALRPRRPAAAASQARPAQPAVPSAPTPPDRPSTVLVALCAAFALASLIACVAAAVL